MKRIGHLWEQFENMDTAIEAIKQGAQHKHGERVIRRKLCYDSNEPKLRGRLDPEKVNVYAGEILTMIRSGWKHGAMREKTIHPIRGKVRQIASPCLKDHIVHWMLVLAIKEPLTRGMYEHSYGSIPGRGIEGARKTVERWVQHDRKAKYFVKLDIRKFYPNVDQNILKAKFRRKIKDEKILDVIDRVIECVPKGLPIGTYTSQWFANFYLQDMDHYIVQDLYKTRRGKRIPFVRHYMRYMDDMLLMGTSKRDLKKAVNAVILYAREMLNLEIKTSWEIRSIAEDRHESGAAVDIVGYRFYRRRTEIRGTIFLHARRVMAKAVKHLKRFGNICLYHAQSLLSLYGWMRHAQIRAFTTRFFSQIPIRTLKGAISIETTDGTFYATQYL